MGSTASICSANRARSYKRGRDFLEQEITQRVHGGPQRWTMVVKVANPGDPTDPAAAEKMLAHRREHDLA
jgi:hypothetical protein